MNNTKTLIDSILETVQLADGPVSCQQVVDDLLKIGIRREKQLINVGLQKLISQGKIIRAREKSVENGPTLYQIAVEAVAVNSDPMPKFEGKIQKLPEKIEIAGVIPKVALEAPAENITYEYKSENGEDVVYKYEVADVYKYEVADADFFPEPDKPVFGKANPPFQDQKAQPTESALNVQIGGDHYKSCKIQPVEYIEANGLPFLEGCVIKRITRHDKPSGKGRQDIEKAIHELKLLLELRYSDEAAAN